MSVHPVHSSHAAAHTDSASKAPESKKHASQHQAVPQDKVTISTEAKKASKAADKDRDGDSK